jgi:hypothetical protein
MESVCDFMSCRVIGLVVISVEQVVVDFSLLLLYNSLLDNQRLTSLSLPTSLGSISKAAFQGCAALTSLSLPTSLVKISNSAFYGCYVLPMVIIPT